MKKFKNEKGIALVTALLLTLIGLAIIMAALYFVTRGTTLSGFQKRYQTSLEASHGGVDIVTKEFIPKAIGGTLLTTFGDYGGFVSYPVSSTINTICPTCPATNYTSLNDLNTCFTDKLTKATSDWGATCSTTFDPKSSPDVVLTLSGAASQPDFNVYAKIVDTVPGNSSTSGIELDGAGVVDSNSGIITPQHFPYIYRLEVQGERKNNPDERANLSAVYAY